MGADPAWSRAVRAATETVGAKCVVAVASGRDGVRHLLRSEAPFSHVLLNPARDDGLLPTILNMTCDDTDSQIELLVLGRSAAAPSRACFITSPSVVSIAEALRRGCRTQRPRWTRRPSVRELRQALAERQVETRYQPLVAMADRAPHGLEVLARLHCGTRGVIGPDHFVPPMEAAGLAGELTALVAARGFADAAEPPLAEARMSVGLNVPLDVLLRADTLERLDALRAGAGLCAGRVTIELTESLAVGDVPRLRAAVERLRRAGYGVSLDDISPQMPGHEALLHLPFTAIKVDQAVVRRSAVSTEAAGFVRRLVDHAKQRGLLVIAEGVHDGHAWQRMRAAGVDVAQGFYIAPPLPVAAIPHWAEVWRERGEPE
ncbi:MAG: EAL domain-containing protein [Proteobacteria bacterium]|nr:EAL domain-containing protein [Pseudomonadota bacterium]